MSSLGAIPCPLSRMTTKLLETLSPPERHLVSWSSAHVDASVRALCLQRAPDTLKALITGVVDQSCLPDILPASPLHLRQQTKEPAFLVARPPRRSKGPALPGSLALPDWALPGWFNGSLVETSTGLAWKEPLKSSLVRTKACLFSLSPWLQFSLCS